jgi:hypothetical protein
MVSFFLLNTFVSVAVFGEYSLAQKVRLSHHTRMNWQTQA